MARILAKPSGCAISVPHRRAGGGLASGVYDAKWAVTDVNGDTRTVTTRFVEQG